MAIMQPQQQYQSPMQPAAESKKNLAQTLVFALLVLSGVILLISGGAWIYLSTKQSSDTGKASQGAASVLEPTESAPALTTVTSQLGMQITYNARELAGFGFSDNVTYSGGDLLSERPYSVVRIRPVETSEATRSEISAGSPELRITSSLDKEYWQQMSQSPEYKDLSKIDQLVKQTNDQRTTDRNITASTASVVQIGDAEYRKVSYTNKNESFGVTTSEREDCYIAVQNDRPYVACINNIRASNFAAVPQLEGVLAALKYSTPDTEVLIAQKEEATEADQAMLDAESDEDVSGRTEPAQESIKEGLNASTEQNKDAKSTAAPSKHLESSADLRTYLRSAPATVRVGMIYCADLQLSLPSGATGPQLTGACVDRAGTGFFVSHEGLLNTAASTVQVRPQDAIRSYIIDAPSIDQMYSRLDRVLGYLVESRSLMQSDADAIRSGIEERNQDAIDKVGAISGLVASENISISKESYKYALQLSDKPIVVNAQNDGGLGFAYSDQVIEAELVAQKLTTEKTREQIQKGEFLEHDVALLKAKKAGTYPALPLATSTNVSAGTNVNLIGMPLYAAGSLRSAQMRPSHMLRQGEAGEVFNGAASQRLLSIKTSSHAGLAGAPALNSSAHVIGVATYGNLNCPPGKCFGGTILRDLVDVRALVRDRNLSLSPSSSANETWAMAVDEMIKGNYRQAHELFNQSAILYPANYLATPYANFTKTQIGSQTDTSSYNTWMRLAQIIAVSSVILLILLLVIRLAMKLFTRPQPQTQYGQQSNGQYIDPTQWQQSIQQPGNIPPAQTWTQVDPYYQGGSPAPNTQQNWPPQQPAVGQQLPNTPAPQPQSTLPPQQPPYTR